MSARNVSTILVACGWCLAVLGCNEPVASDDDGHVTERGPSEASRVQSLFDSLIDGVQLIESAEDVAKQAGSIDDTTDPPSYTVTYEGCVPGFVSGELCVRDGRHLMHVVAPETHIIRSVDQRYDLAQFGSVPEYRLTGSLESHVDVTIDTAAQTTSVDGTATGTLEAAGELEGPVDVSLTVEGGRNYTEAKATPIVVTGTLTHRGESHEVEGGFLRE